MNTSASERIVTEVAAETGTDETELPLLYEAIDPDKLDKLIQSMDDGSVSFTYAGYEIMVTSETEVTISDRPPAPQS